MLRIGCANGPEGLRKYDPDAFALVDDFYSGRIAVTKVEPRQRPRPTDEENAADPIRQPSPAVVAQ